MEKYFKGAPVKLGCGREGEAGREAEEWRAEGGKRVGGRENWEGGVCGRANLVSTSRRAKSEGMRGWWVGEEGADLEDTQEEFPQLLFTTAYTSGPDTYLERSPAEGNTGIPFFFLLTYAWEVSFSS